MEDILLKGKGALIGGDTMKPAYAKTSTLRDPTEAKDKGI